MGALDEIFLLGVKETAGQAVGTARQLLQLFENDRMKIQKLGRAAGSAYRVHQILQNAPVSSIAQLAKKPALAK